MAEIGGNSDVLDVAEKKQEVHEYKEIKPEGETSVKDARSFWDNVFNSDKGDQVDSYDNLDSPKTEVIDGKTHYYDDAGEIYRINNELVPNNSYEINSYKYKTDEMGRITLAEGKLHLKDREGRLPIKDSIDDIGKGDQRASDDRGHLIGDQFDGSNGLENMIPQDANINRNDFKNFENQLAKEVKDNKNVFVQVEPLYEGESRRPDAVVVTYSIEENENIRVFPNGEEGK